MSDFDGARARVAAATGLAGGGVTSGEVDAAIAAAIAGLDIPTDVSDLTDTTGIIPPDPAAITVTTGIPVVLDGGGSAIAAGQIIGEIEVPFSGTITGWTVASKTSGSIVCTVSKATYSVFPTYTAISGSEKPTLSSTTKNQDLSLTTWTTAVTAGDMLQVEVDSATTVTRVTVNIRISHDVGP